MTNVTYQLTASSTIDALKATAQSELKLKTAGGYCAQWFGDRESMRKAKKQFEADAIIPALDPKHRAALAIEIPRGEKTPEAEMARKAKATARGFVASYFSKIESHAFPTPKAEPTPSDDNLAFVKNAIALARKGQKLENPPAKWNMVKIMAHMNGMLKEMNVTSETDADDLALPIKM